MTPENFILKPQHSEIEIGEAIWESPSNIALVKYWGKKPNQVPANPSISFTLSHSKTTTRLVYKKKTGTDFSFDIYFEGRKNEAFKPKIHTFLKRIATFVPFVKDYHFNIETSNTFPHSSGIASSASGLSALALCLIRMEQSLNIDNNMSENYFKQKASFLARLGSGSACRSIEGPVVVWGKNDTFINSSDLFGTRFGTINDCFMDYQDAILLIDKGQKQVSSTVGHQLMQNHPFASQRFNQAHRNLSIMKRVLISGNLEEFIKITESEALTLHAMMMTSRPYFILMKPNTLCIINKIWNYRQETKANICFTLDAGANIHVLFPKNESKKIYKFINDELSQHCENGQFIKDEVGMGAKEIKL